MDSVNGAIFLDRDGTLIEDVNYLRNIEDIHLLPGAVEAVRRINQSGIPAVIVTNQSAVARGMLSEEELVQIQLEINRIFDENGAHFDAFYYCPHHPEFGNHTYRIECDCRKPRPGMLLGAAKELGLSLSESVMVGDSESDVQAGRAGGCKTVLLAPSAASAEKDFPNTVADFVAFDILNAVDWALENMSEQKSD